MEHDSLEHPAWCERRDCVGEYWPTATHREPVHRWRPIDNDLEVTLGVTRMDEMFRGEQVIGEPVVWLAAAAPASVDSVRLVDGAPTRIDVDTFMTPADARLLAALLVCAAERVERAVAAGGAA